MALAAGTLVSSASADLTIHLRLAETPTVNGGAVALTGLGQVVDMGIWAAVTDGNGDPSDEAVWKFYSAYYSSNGGAMLGDLATSKAPFEWAPGVFIELWIVQPPPRNRRSLRLGGFA